jgi:hypothetical protein
MLPLAEIATECFNPAETDLIVSPYPAKNGTNIGLFIGVTL